MPETIYAAKGVLFALEVQLQMPRPKKCRQLSSCVPCSLFKPNGIPAANLSQILLAADEFEALELGDVQRLSQLEAAAQMGISRQTFGYLLASARQKVATAITQGLVLKLPTPNDKDPV